ncbi:MAG: hypothetical protein U0350_22390 [Caldilineaceae bacterium]
MDHEKLDPAILERMPYFIAVNYQRLLEAETAQERVKLALHTYNLGLRALTIGLVSQYLVRDRDQVSDSYLNDLLAQKFPHLTLDAWQQLLFATLRAYEGHGDLFFMAELYDFYWDTTVLPHKQRREVETLFSRLTQIALELQTNRIVPQDETAWAALADETTSLLRQVLQHVLFIGQYDLVRVLAYDTQFYTFELHKGLTITRGQRPLPKNTKLEQGWFYLREATEELLPLYPFLVFWEEHKPQAQLSTPDVAIYDKFIYEQLQYLLAMLGQTIVNDSSVQAFIRLVYDTLEEAKRQRQLAEKLTWWQLRDICVDITRLRIATVEKKYRSELYLERNKTRQAFERFLQSKERCFVLIGKSGVGKSNFFLALREELQARSDVCVLMYDSASLRVESSVTTVISQDFDNRLVLAGQRIQEVWREIAKIDGIEERLVILFVDAINEHPQAKELLRQLDELAQAPWPWLKVVFSSRPETWQTIKRGVRLAEGLYYREEGAETLGVELEPFTYSEKLEPFSAHELPAAYAKYQAMFKLQTMYEAIPVELRSVLHDPLSLWLVASTYANRPVPKSLKVTELIEQYVMTLQQSQRLQTDDLRLLEERLVPLLVRAGQPTNALTIADIDAAGEGLYESIYSEQVLSDGRRVNQSFLNLVDTEILAVQAEGREQKIAFKYERFYEYFVGKALYESLEAQNTGPTRQYTEWLSHLPQSPFLWGAMKSCLEQQLRSLPAEACAALCLQLAHIDNQRMKEILIAALTEYGQDESEKTRQILSLLLKQARGWWKALTKRAEMTAQCPAWKQVAIVVASNLRWGELLELALTDQMPAVRAVAMRHAYIFWRQQREAGFGILERLVGKSTGLLGIPLPAVFESCMGLSLLILFDDFRNSATTSRLRTIWRQAIERLLWINPQQLGSRRERVKGWIRTTLIRLVTGFIIRTGSEVPPNSLLNVPEFIQFYRRNSDLERRRRVLRSLIPYLDTNTTDIRALREELLQLAPEKDLLIAVLALAVIQKHGIMHPERTIPLVRELFERATSIDPPGPFAGAVPSSAFIAEAIPYWNDKSRSDVRALLLDIFTTYLDRFQGKWRTGLHEYRFTFPDQITWWETNSSGDVPISPLAKRYVDQMITKQDYAWLQDIIKWELTVNGAETGNLRFTFSTLEIVLKVPDIIVQNSIIELLARMRVYYPDEVDDFMEVHELNEEFMARVRTRTPSETIGDLLNVRALHFWIVAIVLGSAPRFWQSVIWLLKQLPESRNLEQFVVILLKFIVNHVYNDVIFTDIPV